MFQWSSNRRRTEQPNGGTGTSAYPGQRTVVPSSSAVQGSIRPPSSSSYNRSQHLDSYLNDETLKRSTRRVPPGDSIYETVFQTVQGDTLILRVELPFNSNTRPILALAGVRAQHAWLDGRMRVVGYGPLQSDAAWNQAGTLLGPAVQAVVTELQVHPPTILEIVDNGLRNIQSKHRAGGAANTSTTTTTTSSMSSSHQDAPPDYSTVLNGDTTTSTTAAAASAMSSSSSRPPLPSLPPIDLPTLPTQFPSLKDLDRDELDQLIKDELDFQAYVHKHVPVCQELQGISSSVVDDNALTAQQHLDEHQPVVDELRTKCVQLQEELQQKVAQFQSLEQEQDALCRPPDRRKVVKELQKAKKEAFGKSEQMAEDWLEENDCASTVDRFVKDFIKERKLHHLRAAKLELLELNPPPVAKQR